MRRFGNGPPEAGKPEHQNGLVGLRRNDGLVRRVRLQGSALCAVGLCKHIICQRRKAPDRKLRRAELSVFARRPDADAPFRAQHRGKLCLGGILQAGDALGRVDMRGGAQNDPRAAGQLQAQLQKQRGLSAAADDGGHAGADGKRLTKRQRRHAYDFGKGMTRPSFFCSFRLLPFSSTTQVLSR